MQAKSEHNTDFPSPDNNSQSKLICKKCRKGYMLPATEEGFPEYTDQFRCSHCHHRDTISTKDLLFSQTLSALAGIGICIYLLIVQLSTLFRGIQHDIEINTLKTSALIFIAGLFLSGFIYLLFRVQDGYRHRKLYTQATKSIL